MNLFGSKVYFQLLCLLEFYVHYKVQRRGFGKKIIDTMLHDEHAEAYQARRV